MSKWHKMLLICTKYFCPSARSDAGKTTRIMEIVTDLVTSNYVESGIRPQSLLRRLII